MEDMPLAVFPRKLKTKSKESTNVDSFKVSREGHPDQTPPSNQDESRIGEFLLMMCYSECHGLKYLLQGLKIFLKIPANSA